METKIYILNGWVNIKPEQPVNTMRRLNSFCVFNSLKNCIVKLQGGYYLINRNNQFEFIDRTLSNISFDQVFNLLKSI